jgi:hypothetical protein
MEEIDCMSLCSLNMDVLIVGISFSIICFAESVSQQNQQRLFFPFFSVQSTLFICVFGFFGQD